MTDTPQTHENTVTFDSNGFAQSKGTVTIYTYDPQGVYTGTEDYDIPQYTGVPALSTRVAPPAAADGKVAVFDQNTQSWSEMEDHRGTKVWDKSSGSSYTFSKVGPIPDTVTTVAPSTQYYKWDNATNGWVNDEVAARAGLVAQAKAAMQEATQAAQANGWLMLGIPDDVTAYVKSLQAIVQGKDTTSTALPAKPAELSN